MQISNDICRSVALAGLLVLLAACEQDHHGDHGHAHEGGAAHAHAKNHQHGDDHVHDSLPKTEAFYAEEADTSTEEVPEDRLSESTATDDTEDESTRTDKHSHAHGDGEVHAH